MVNYPADLKGSDAKIGFVVVNEATKEVVATFLTEREAMDDKENRGRGYSVKRFSREKDSPIEIDWGS